RRTDQTDRREDEPDLRFSLPPDEEKGKWGVSSLEGSRREGQGCPSLRPSGLLRDAAFPGSCSSRAIVVCGGRHYAREKGERWLSHGAAGDADAGAAAGPRAGGA